MNIYAFSVIIRLSVFSQLIEQFNCELLFLCLFAMLSNLRMQDPQSALTLFERIRQTHPTSTAAQYGFAKAFDNLADLKRNNEFLRRAINEYEKYISLGAKLNDTDFRVAAERCIERMRFIGNVYMIFLLALDLE